MREHPSAVLVTPVGIWYRCLQRRSKLGIGTANHGPPIYPVAAGRFVKSAMDQKTDNNPGTPEGLTIPGWEYDYRLIIGVARQGETEGAFKIEFWGDPYLMAEHTPLAERMRP